MTLPRFAQLPDPPYYSVIFSSQRTSGDNGYGDTAERMVELAIDQPGFLGIESVRGADGFGITVSYWSSLAAIADWKRNAEHRIAQETGRAIWYAQFEIRIARVEQVHSYSQ
jgi:heme-degrading monooxygenase HmoA